jgi:hypothetical protein
MVTVNAYGVYKNITLPLICKVFQPRGTLKIIASPGLKILRNGESTWRCQFLSRQSGEPEGWEIIFSVYTMITFSCPALVDLDACNTPPETPYQNSVKDI